MDDDNRDGLHCVQTPADAMRHVLAHLTFAGAVRLISLSLGITQVHWGRPRDGRVLGAVASGVLIGMAVLLALGAGCAALLVGALVFGTVLAQQCLHAEAPQ